VLVNGQPYTGGPIPYGSVIDVTKGRLLLKTDLGTVLVYGGVFILLRGTEVVRTTSAVVQKPKPKTKRRAVIEMRLTRGDFKVCGKRSTSAAGQKKKPKVVRKLWANGKGRFRTRGRYSSATVRGTFWLTEDRCDGTRTLVRQGRIEVLDFVTKKKILLRAGKSYLAKPKTR